MGRNDIGQTEVIWDFIGYSLIPYKCKTAFTTLFFPINQVIGKKSQCISQLYCNTFYIWEFLFLLT